MSDRTLSYKPGTWFGIVGEHVTVLLPASEKSRAGALWAIVDDGAGFDAVLDALVSAGLSTLPGFVLLSSEDDAVRVMIRGEAEAVFETAEGEVTVTGSRGTMWVERAVELVSAFAVVLPGEPVDGPDLSVAAGLVRLAGIATPQPTRLAPVVSLAPASTHVDPIHDPITESYSGLFAAVDPAAPVDEPFAPAPAPLGAAQALEEPLEEPGAEPEAEEPEQEHEEEPSMLDHLFGPVDDVEEHEPAAVEPPAPSFPPPPPLAVPPAPSFPPPPAPPTGPPPGLVGGLPPMPPAPPIGLPPAPPAFPGGPDDVATGQLDAVADHPTEAIPLEAAPLAAAPTQAAPLEAVPLDDHDGLTRAGLPDIPPPPPGIPGQVAAPRVTAYAVAHLSFSSGEEVDVDRVIVVGRAPEAGRFSAEDQPLLVTVPSPHQEISSTHVEVRPGTGVDHGAAVVTDLGSTNGTLVVQPGLGPEELRPGVPVQLMPGALIDLGDGLTIRVSHP